MPLSSIALPSKHRTALICSSAFDRLQNGPGDQLQSIREEAQIFSQNEQGLGSSKKKFSAKAQRRRRAV
jgi:hypothetical protein